ncbi:MAG TPA: hypothetical protein VI299_09410 [Polyangiales bacterium]
MLLFAPGIGSFLLAQAMTGLGLLLLFVTAVPVVCSDSTKETQAFTSLGFVQLAAALVIVPSLMLMKGWPLASKVWRTIVTVGLAGAAFGAAFAWSHQRAEAVRFTIATAALGVAFLVLRTVGFAMITIFRQRIKVRREAYLAEIQAIKRSL